MRGAWALLATVCGVIAAWMIGSIVPHMQWPPNPQSLLGLALSLALLYATWRSALRVFRPHTVPVGTRPTTTRRGVSPRRVAASLILAFVVMFVSGPIGLYIADSGNWGGEHGILFWSLLLLGRGLSIAANKLHLARSLSVIIVFVQFALLAGLFYSLASWWAKRRGSILETARPRFSPDSKRRVGVAVSATGFVLAVATITAVALLFVQRGRNLLPSAEGSEGVEAFQVGPTRWEVLWRIEAPPGKVLEHLGYGEVPVGFRQAVPRSGRPRPLRNGESLIAQVLTPHRVFENYGRAVGGDRFVSGITSSAPRISPHGISLDQMRRAIRLDLPVGTRMPSVRERMESQGFACQETRDGIWNDQVHGDFLACRRAELDPSGKRQWEVAFFSSGAKLEEFLLRITPIEQPAR